MDPKIDQNGAVFQMNPSTHRKIMSRIGFLIENNNDTKTGFDSNGSFGPENEGSKGPPPRRVEDPPVWPEGGPGKNLKESASHHFLSSQLILMKLGVVLDQY